MEVRPVQFNINTKSLQPSPEQKKEYKSYLEAEGAIPTEDKVKPLPGKGHLIHDTLLTGPKYFFKDIAYDMKAVKDGIKGTANDHQLGRINDVGLRVGGIGIAAYLASKTADPKLRMMEYIGLGAFLTSMAIFPKIAINTPAKLIHGYDVDKWYIDDQGRKKSVNQDSNYRPMDLYRGDAKGEDLGEIGDKMGIPRDIKNRNALTDEQTRKLSTQCNTLWMLTAGIATPAMAGLISYLIENHIVVPGLENSRNKEYNKMIEDALKRTESMANPATDNNLSNSVKEILEKYKGKEIPKEESEKVINMITKNLDEISQSSIRKDLENIFKNSSSAGTESVVINSQAVEEMITAAKNTISKDQKSLIEPILVPTKEEIDNILKKVISADDISKGATGVENIAKIRKELQELINKKIKQAPEEIPEEFLDMKRNDIIEKISKSLKTKKVLGISETGSNQIIEFAKIIGEFKSNRELLDKCYSFKFEYAPETEIATAYEKFEKTFLKELGISYKELRKMRESEKFTKELLDKKLTELCKDEARYQKVMEKFGKIISEMEAKLHGSKESSSHILNLVKGIENNYNNTAKRLASLNSSMFGETIKGLVQEDVSKLSNSVNTVDELRNLLDGLIGNKFANFNWGAASDADRRLYCEYNAKGIGSSKNIEITRLIERYQGSKNSLFRVLETMEIYKRAAKPETYAEHLNSKGAKYLEEVIKIGKEALLNGSVSDFFQKLHIGSSNHLFFRDVAISMLPLDLKLSEGKAPLEQFGFVTDSAEKALGKADKNVLTNFRQYIAHLRNIWANNGVDFTRPNHNINPNDLEGFHPNTRRNASLFNLLGQNPVDLARGAAGRRYGTQTWLRIIGGTTAGVFAVALLAQLGFNKIRNPHNIQKQVKNETDK